MWFWCLYELCIVCNIHSRNALCVLWFTSKYQFNLEAIFKKVNIELMHYNVKQLYFVVEPMSREIQTMQILFTHIELLSVSHIFILLQWCVVYIWSIAAIFVSGKAAQLLNRFTLWKYKLERTIEKIALIYIVFSNFDDILIIIAIIQHILSYVT